MMLSRDAHESWISSKLRHKLQCSIIDEKLGYKFIKCETVVFVMKGKSYANSSIDLVYGPTAAINHRSTRAIQMVSKLGIS